MRLRILLLTGALLGLAALPAGAQTTTVRCPDLTLTTRLWAGTGYASSPRTPVRDLDASGLDCAAARAVFAGASVPVSGGGANEGVAWGSRQTASPPGWRCRLTVGYWAARHHADTLDWVHGWSELCLAPGRSLSFTEGTRTPWRLTGS